MAFLMMALMGPIFPGVSEGAWTKVKDQNGIRVYQRPVPSTGLVEYKAVTVIDHKIEVIGEALRDVPYFKNWVADCKEAKIVKKFDRNTFITYMVLQPPVIENRDIVLEDRTRYDFENGKASISFYSVDYPDIPPQKGLTRITVMDGDYTMEFLGREKTKFIYRLKVDPAGSIPRRVAYAVMKNLPYQTLFNLKKILGTGRYASSARGTPEEKKIESLIVDPGAVRKILTARLSRFVKQKEVLGGIIARDREGITRIIASGGSYAGVEKATTGYLLEYIRRTSKKEAGGDAIKNNSGLVSEITDLITYDCGVASRYIDDIAVKY